MSFLRPGVVKQHKNSNSNFVTKLDLRKKSFENNYSYIKITHKDTRLCFVSRFILCTLFDAFDLPWITCTTDSFFILIQCDLWCVSLQNEPCIVEWSLGPMIVTISMYIPWRKLQILQISFQFVDHTLLLLPDTWEGMAKWIERWDSRLGGLGFDSQWMSCVEMLGKLRIPRCLSPPSRNGYLVQRVKIGSIIAGCLRCPLLGDKWSTDYLHICSDLKMNTFTFKCLFDGVKFNELHAKIKPNRWNIFWNSKW